MPPPPPPARRPDVRRDRFPPNVRASTLCTGATASQFSMGRAPLQPPTPSPSVSQLSRQAKAVSRRSTTPPSPAPPSACCLPHPSPLTSSSAASDTPLRTACTPPVLRVPMRRYPLWPHGARSLRRQRRERVAGIRRGCRGKCIAQRKTAKEYRTCCKDSPPPFRLVSHQQCCLRHPRRECSTPLCAAISRLVAPYPPPTSPPPPSACLSRTAYTAPVLVLRTHTPAPAVAALGNGRCRDNGE